MGKGGMIFYDTGNMMKIICQMKGSVLLSVWPQMAITAGIAIFATLLRAQMGADEYIIKDVKGHATVGHLQILRNSSTCAMA